jgi:hypothetical protein
MQGNPLNSASRPSRPAKLVGSALPKLLVDILEALWLLVPALLKTRSCCRRQQGQFQ